jgi:hypothetical protein
VGIIAQYLARKGRLEAFAHEVRLVRGRFGTYEPIDFLALLLGYAISGERTLADFFEPLAPLRLSLHGSVRPQKSASSLQLEPLASLMWIVPVCKLFVAFSSSIVLQRDGLRRPSVESSIGRVAATSSLLSMPHARQLGLEACPLIHPCLPLDADWMRNVAPGHSGRKRGEVVRTRTVARRDA